MGYSAGRHYSDAQGYAAQYPADTDERIDRCPTSPISALKECVEVAVTAAHDAQRSEQDLNAQRDMAKWAWWLLIVSLGTLAISGIGLIALIRTIALAREANSLTKDSIETQHRPWVKFEVTEPGFRIHNDRPIFRVRAKIENTGGTPALGVCYFASLALGPATKEHLDETIRAYRENKINWRELNLFPNDDLTRIVTCEHDGLIPEDPAKVGYYFVAMYRTPFSQTPRYTAHVYKIVDTRRDDDLIDFKSYPYGEHLKLRPDERFVGYAT